VEEGREKTPVATYQSLTERHLRLYIDVIHVQLYSHIYLGAVGYWYKGKGISDNSMQM
jgi:hypothetical protein